MCAAAQPGPVTVQVCATQANGDCCGMWTGNIQVMYCPAVNDTDHFYVYKLIHSVYCDSAYCAIDRSSVQSNTDLFSTGISTVIITSGIIAARLCRKSTTCILLLLTLSSLIHKL